MDKSHPPIGFAITLLLFLTFSNTVKAEEGMISFLDKQRNTKCSFKVELAITAPEQEKGLMFRSSLCNNCGMLFVFDGDGMRNFWMKNTYIPLDMIFIDSNLRVVHIHKHAKPNDLNTISSVKPCQYVLEINAGKTDTCSIKKGDYVKYENIMRY